MNGNDKTNDKTKKRALLVVIAVTLAFCVTASAMSVDEFTDYNPPSTLVISWYDYFSSSLHSGPSTNNTVTQWTRWSVEYPYRAVFIGGDPRSGQTQGHRLYMYVVYSKTATTNLFTFEYRPGAKASGQTGRIRALYDKDHGDDIHISYLTSPGMTSGTLETGQLSTCATYTYGSHVVGSKAYFEFDFYYQCTDKHQKNSKLVSINGLRSVPDVPYPYILTCDAHGGSGSAESGSSSSSSSSGGNSGGSGEPPGGGNPSGGGEDLTGGGNEPAPSESSKYPWEKDESTPDYGGSSSVPEHSKGSEGDTGERGGTWTLPEYSTPDKLPFGDKDLNIPAMPNTPAPPNIPVPDFNFPSAPVPDFNFPSAPGMPDLNFPEMPYIPGDGGWPPPFPS